MKGNAVSARPTHPAAAQKALDKVRTDTEYAQYFCAASRLTVVTPLKKEINGKIYERAFLEAWLQQGAPWDPADKSLFTQHAFRPLTSEELTQWQAGKVAAQKRINLEASNPRVFNALFLQTDQERRAQVEQAAKQRFAAAQADHVEAPDEFVCPISTLFIQHPIDLPIRDSSDSSQAPTLTPRPYEGPLIKRWLAEKQSCPMTNAPRRLGDLRVVSGNYQRKRTQFLRAHPKYYQEILPAERLKALKVIREPAIAGRKRPASEQPQTRRVHRYRPGTVSIR